MPLIKSVIFKSMKKLRQNLEKKILLNFYIFKSFILIARRQPFSKVWERADLNAGDDFEGEILVQSQKQSHDHNPHNDKYRNEASKFQDCEAHRTQRHYFDLNNLNICRVP